MDKKEVFPMMKRLAALALAALLCVGLVPMSRAETAPGLSGIKPPSLSLTVFFTHDTHDHFYPDSAGVGGYTRLAALLNAQREGIRHATVTVDAGDFSMGSLFQTIYSTHAPELRALGRMGYDAVTLGNHEFDYRPQGLADMLNAAKESGDPLPALVQANYKTPKDPATEGMDALLDAFADFPVTDYTVITRPGQGHYKDGSLDYQGDTRIAVFGVMGVDSDECAPMSGMTLEPVAEAAQRVVDEIKAKEDPDFIICLSHTGTVDGKGEDYDLAKAVDGIDLIISGHTHTTLDDPIEVNGTYIVSAGPYTQNLGRITLKRTGDETACEEYSLLHVNESNRVEPDADMTSFAQSCKEEVDKTYLADYGLAYDQVLASGESDFTIPEMGDYIGNAYIQTVKELEGDAYVPIAFAVAPDGVIRDTIRAGGVTTSQAFDILSLGSGADGSPGYPLVSVYLTGKDLKNAFEVDASVSALMPAATLYGAGSYWRYNPNRMFLDRVAECWITTQDGNIAGSIADKKLYRVVADLYSGQMLSTVKSKSMGLLSITPRDENGNEVTDFETRIIHDANGNEVKAWYALASHLKNVGTVEKAPVSKRATSSWNPIDLLFPMGVPTLVVTLLVLVLILAVVLIVRAIVKRKRRKAK